MAWRGRCNTFAPRATSGRKNKLTTRSARRHAPFRASSVSPSVKSFVFDSVGCNAVDSDVASVSVSRDSVTGSTKDRVNLLCISSSGLHQGNVTPGYCVSQGHSSIQGVYDFAPVDKVDHIDGQVECKVLWSVSHSKKCTICRMFSKEVDWSGVLEIASLIRKSGRPNFRGCCIPVGSNLDITRWRDGLLEYKDRDLVECLEFGFPVGFEGNKEHLQHRNVKNHAGALEFPSNILEYLSNQAISGCIIGPFKADPFVGEGVFSPISTVPKKDSDERRVILDLSWPKGKGVNDHIPKDFYLGDPFRLHYPSVDNLCDLVRQLGKGCLLFKRDLRRAYRQIPVDPGDISLLGFQWKSHMFFDRVLPMGLRSACQACQRMTSGVQYMFAKEGFNLVNYIDDLAGAESVGRATAAFEVLGKLLTELGLIEAVDKAVPPSTSMVFLGVEFDTQQCLLSIPFEKVTEVLNMLEKWAEKAIATRRELQVLVGKLNFVASCVRPGRLFISRLLNVLRGFPSVGTGPLSGDFHRDLHWWQTYLRQFNGVSILSLEEWSFPDEVAASDACLEACRGWCEGEYFHILFPDWVREAHLHINALELLTIMVCLKVWGAQWGGRKVKFACDNLASVFVLNSGKSKDVFMQGCLREICYIAALGQFEIRAVHVPGVDNRLPDLLSRWHLSAKYEREFHDRTSHIYTKQITIRESLFRFSHKW